MERMVPPGQLQNPRVKNLIISSQTSLWNSCEERIRQERERPWFFFWTEGFRNLPGSISTIINAEGEVRPTVGMVCVDTDRYSVISGFLPVLRAQMGTEKRILCSLIYSVSPFKATIQPKHELLPSGPQQPQRHPWGSLYGQTCSPRSAGTDTGNLSASQRYTLLSSLGHP